LNQDKTTSAMPIHHHQGKTIKAAVDASKLRVNDIARMAKIPVSSLYDIFKKEDIPRKKLERLCEALELNFEETYFGPQTILDPQQTYVLKADMDKVVFENDFLKQRVADLEKIISLIDRNKNADQPAATGN
jgi:DNA-binding Xre family transcriptional regulator